MKSADRPVTDSPVAGAHARWALGATVPPWLQAHRQCALSETVQVIRADTLDQVIPALDQAWQASCNGHWLAGFVAYEAAPAFDPALCVASLDSSAVPHPKTPDLPLVFFMVAHALSHTEFPVASDVQRPRTDAAVFDVSRPWLMQTHLGTTQTPAVMQVVRDAIEQGRYYQLNLTTRLAAQGQGDARVLFDRLLAAQPRQYGFCLQTEDWSVISASPELFFHWDGEHIETRPMKGTVAPSGDSQRDQAMLRDSAKDRAENVMIVDLLRNDLSRVASPGSVRVTSLFDVETYPTVVQMTSAVQARTRCGLGLTDIFRALFPCGSVTGAPKAEAMRHLSELEGRRRGVYCGAVGVLAPGGRALFNVAIRTVVHHRSTQELIYGVGSGLTWYSDPQAEWTEWQWKARLAHRCAQAFDVLETARLQDGLWVRMDAHLSRMRATAQYFGYAFDEIVCRRQLLQVAQGQASGLWRGRWLLSATGTLQVQLHPLVDLPLPLTLQWASSAVDSHSDELPFILHKTTWRVPYDRHASALSSQPDVLLHTQAGLLTETPRGNLILANDHGYWTPATRWQLPGILQQCLQQGGHVEQRDLTGDDLRCATGLWVVNSLRGWMPVERIVDSQGVTLWEIPLADPPLWSDLPSRNG